MLKVMKIVSCTLLLYLENWFYSKCNLSSLYPIEFSLKKKYCIIELKQCYWNRVLEGTIDPVFKEGSSTQCMVKSASLIHIERFGKLLSPFPTELVHICVFCHCIHSWSSVSSYYLLSITCYAHIRSLNLLSKNMICIEFEQFKPVNSHTWVNCQILNFSLDVNFHCVHTMILQQ